MSFIDHLQTAPRNHFKISKAISSPYQSGQFIYTLVLAKGFDKKGVSILQPSLP